MSWRAINIDYTLHAEVKKVIFFRVGYNSNFTAQKYSNFGYRANNYLIKIGLLEVTCRGQMLRF